MPEAKPALLRVSAALRVKTLENPYPGWADWVRFAPVSERSSMGPLLDSESGEEPHREPVLRKLTIEMVREELSRQGLHFREISQSPAPLWGEAEMLLASAPASPPLPMLLVAPSTLPLARYSQERQELANVGVFVVRLGSPELRGILQHEGPRRSEAT